MKKIDKLILSVFLRPFIITFLFVLFMFLMLFFFRSIDSLLGKGYEWYVLLELIFWISMTNVSFALPLSVLLSSLMSFGALAENYELVAIKSAGVPLTRAIRMAGIFTAFMGIFTFYFSDYILPVANLKAGSILYDINNQKSAILFNQGKFNNSIPGYGIKVERKDENGRLYDVAIFDHKSNRQGQTFIRAKEADMYITDNLEYLVLKLKDGVHYQEQKSKLKRNEYRFVKTYFGYSEQKFPLSGFNLKRTELRLFKNNRQVMDIGELKKSIRQFAGQIDSVSRYIKIRFCKDYKVLAELNTSTVASIATATSVGETNKYAEIMKPYQEKGEIYKWVAIKNKLASIKRTIKNNMNILQETKKTQRLFEIELQKKYVITVTCLLMFLIGAPLGAIIRKGGLGLPLVVAVLFFVFNYVLSSFGEKSVKEDSMGLINGMWMPVYVLLPLSIFLLYMGSRDSKILNLAFYKKLFRFRFKRRVK